MTLRWEFDLEESEGLDWYSGGWWEGSGLVEQALVLWKEAK